MRFFVALVAGAFCFCCSVSAYEREGDLRVQRWLSARVLPQHRPKVDKVVRRIMLYKSRYVEVDRSTGVPWYVIASLHNMESGGSFREHLHCGGSLAYRTRWIPRGRPKTGRPPFTWEYSAKDALAYDNMGGKRWAYLFDSLWGVQMYNGTGYWRYHRDTPSPYLYAKTTIEKPGKYVSDGRWSSTARSKQVGVVAIWKRMEAKGVLCFSRLK